MQLEPAEKRHLAQQLGADEGQDRSGNVYSEALARLITHIESCHRCGKRLVELRRNHAFKQRH
jgi:hypothetical protein